MVDDTSQSFVTIGDNSGNSIVMSGGTFQGLIQNPTISTSGPYGGALSLGSSILFPQTLTVFDGFNDIIDLSNTACVIVSGNSGNVPINVYDPSNIVLIGGNNTTHPVIRSLATNGGGVLDIGSSSAFPSSIRLSDNGATPIIQMGLVGGLAVSPNFGTGPLLYPTADSSNNQLLFKATSGNNILFLNSITLGCSPSQSLSLGSSINVWSNLYVNNITIPTGNLPVLSTAFTNTFTSYYREYFISGEPITLTGGGTLFNPTGYFVTWDNADISGSGILIPSSGIWNITLLPITNGDGGGQLCIGINVGPNIETIGVCNGEGNYFPSVSITQYFVSGTEILVVGGPACSGTLEANTKLTFTLITALTP